MPPLSLGLSEFGAMWFYGVVAFAFGVLTGLSEILPRYRDDPLKAALCPAGVCYWAFNGVVSFLGFLAVCFYFGDSFELVKPEGGLNHPALLSATAIAGFGAMTLARAKVFQVALPNGQMVSAGPAHVLDVLFGITDAYIAKHRMARRVKLVEEKIKEVDFNQLKDRIPTLVTSARQSLSTGDHIELGRTIARIAAEQVAESERNFRAAYLLLDYVGEEFFREYSFAQLKAVRAADVAMEMGPEESISIE